MRFAAENLDWGQDSLDQLKEQMAVNRHLMDQMQNANLQRVYKQRRRDVKASGLANWEDFL